MKMGLLALFYLLTGLYLIIKVNIVLGAISSLIGFVCMFKYLIISKSLKKRDENNQKNPWDDTFLPPR